MSVAAPSSSLITCSFSGDLEVCGLLCESVDRFVPGEMQHQLYVPRKDMPLFQRFASHRRAIGAQEDLLPGWFWNVPLPSPRWRALLRLPRRNIYLTPYSAPVRGWIAQQIMKIAAANIANTEIVVHVDSDNAFIRPFSIENIWQNDRIRLYRNHEMVPLDGHRLWHAAAGALLGLPPSDFHGAEYIDQIVVWKRSVVRAMIARLQQVSGKDWRIALARTPHFAEYILYGVFADRVLGLEQAGLYGDEKSLCLSRWSGAFADSQDEAAFLAAIEPQHVACLIQSTISMNLADRRRLFERAAAMAS